MVDDIKKKGRSLPGHIVSIVDGDVVVKEVSSHKDGYMHRL